MIEEFTEHLLNMAETYDSDLIREIANEMKIMENDDERTKRLQDMARGAYSNIRQ
jgi:hypothetical protein